MARRRCAVGKTGAVVHVGCRGRLPWQSGIKAGVQGVALIVIEGEEAGGGMKIRQTSADGSTSQRHLVGVSQVHTSDTAQAGRLQRELPATNERSVNGDREKCVRVPHGIVVKEVFYMSTKFVRVELPAAEWDSHAELALFVAFAMERNEIQVLAGDEIQQRARSRNQGRGLVKGAIETAKDPIQVRNLHRHSDARTSGVLNDRTREVRLPDAANHGKPRSQL